MRRVVVPMLLAAGIVTASSLLSEPMAADTDSAYIGRIDTIGTTTYDWQFNWSALRHIVNAPGYGIHAAWLLSADTTHLYPDRNKVLSFYDYQTRTWSSATVFAERAGFGNLDVDPVTQVAALCCYGGMPVRMIAAREMTPGSGIFEFCEGQEGFLWPAMAIGQNRWIHVGMIDNETRNGLWYSRIRDWGTWDSTVWIAEPEMPTQNIAASKVSHKVCLAWVEDDGYWQCKVSYRLSVDGGEIWGPMIQLPYPPAYGGDTLTSFSVCGIFPFYDSEDRLHFAASVSPVVNDTWLIQPAEIWHWCEENEPDWTEIHRAGCDPQNLQAGNGYNAIYADRPSMGENSHGYLYVAWEQFDSSNVEPETNLLRAGIWLAASDDNGASWNPGLKITQRNTVSHRYPCIIDKMVSGSPDTVTVLYMMDLVAGAAVQGQGRHMYNPMVVQFVPAELIGLEESRLIPTEARELLWPNPAVGVVCLAGTGHPDLLDVTGRKVAELQPGANDLRYIPAGVYFVRGPAGSVVQKLVVQSP